MILLERAGASLSRHRIILVGDLINKGPFSLDVLKWTRDQGVECVVGNHELRFLKNAKDGLRLTEPLKELKKQMGSDLSLWLGWIDALPAYIETQDFFVVHGGFHPKLSPTQTSRDILASIRTWNGKDDVLYQQGDPPWYQYYEGKKPVFYGHWALQGLHFEKNTYGLDTGCVYGRKLSGIWTHSKDVVQTPALEAYCSIK